MNTLVYYPRPTVTQPFARVDSMRRTPWMLYLWPGLPQLWLEGSWLGLAVATSSAALLNFAIIASFMWVEWVAAPLVRSAWLAVGAVWIGGAMLSYWTGRRTPISLADSAGDLYPTALVEYLQGNWYEAETLLGRLLRANPRDIEARLMLATLLRHVGRSREAREQLTHLERLEDAARWQTEIAAERRFLAESPRQAANDSSTQAQAA